MPLPQPSDSFAWTQEPWGPALRCLPLQGVAPHIFTSAAVDVSRDPEDPDLAAVAASVGLDPASVMQVHQVHGREVVVVRKCDSHTSVPAGSVTVTLPADALVTDDSSRAVGVRVADCVPILLAERSGRVVAAAHAGWRGTAAGVVSAALNTMRERFGTDPGDLFAALGPSICAGCYEVGPELRTAFHHAGHNDASVSRWFAPGKGDRLHLDVSLANRDQLEAFGIPVHHIFECGLCTAHNDGVFHSYRRQGARAGRALALIRVRDQGAGSGGSS